MSNVNLCNSVQSICTHTSHIHNVLYMKLNFFSCIQPNVLYVNICMWYLLELNARRERRWGIENLLAPSTFLSLSLSFLYFFMLCVNCTSIDSMKLIRTSFVHLVSKIIIDKLYQVTQALNHTNHCHQTQ